MGKKGKKSKSSKGPSFGPTALERKRNALVCSLASYLEVDKTSIAMSENGKIFFKKTKEEEEEEDKEFADEENKKRGDVEEKQQQGHQGEDTATASSVVDEAATGTTELKEEKRSKENEDELSVDRDKPLPQSDDQSNKHSSRSVSRSSNHQQDGCNASSLQGMASNNNNDSFSSSSSSSSSGSSSESSSDNEDGYDSEGLPLSPHKSRRIVPTRPSHHHRSSSSSSSSHTMPAPHHHHRKHCRENETRKKRKKRHRHSGHHKHHHHHHHLSKTAPLPAATSLSSQDKSGETSKLPIFLTATGNQMSAARAKLGDSERGLIVQVLFLNFELFFFPSFLSRSMSVLLVANKKKLIIYFFFLLHLLSLFHNRHDFIQHRITAHDIQIH